MTMLTYLLGLDIGTQGTKGLLITPDGDVRAEFYEPLEVMRDHPGQAEQDPETAWWGSLCRVTRGLLAASGATATEVAAVGVSAMTPNVALLDAEGRVLRPALLYGDRRMPWQEDERPSAGWATGIRPGSVAARLLWVQRHEPEIWAQVRHALTTTSYVVWRLTGRFTIDRATAHGYDECYARADGKWDAAYCEAMGLRADLFPADVLGSTDVAGEVTAEAAEATGLAPGTPVIVGTADAFAEMVSAGVIVEGDACFLYGTFVALIVARKRKNPEESFIHCLEGLSFGGAGLQSGGALVRWFRDTFAQAEVAAEGCGGPSAYAALDDLAEGIPPGSEGLLALPRWEGPPGGALLGLTLAHSRAHLYRALLEGLAFEVRRQMEEEGLSPAEMVAAGGGSRSHLWTQIVSDVTGIAQHCLARPLGAPLGAAYLAGLGVGLLEGFEPLCRRWLRFGREVRPRATARAEYDAIYRAYCAEYRRRYESNR
jgi:xylulokinase